MARGRDTKSDGGKRWELYRLLGDATRLRMLGLCALEELAVSELAELLGLGQPLVSRQAAVLRDAGLLAARRQGTWLLLRVAADRTQDPVVADAIDAGRAECERNGLGRRLAALVARRDQRTREFFAKGGRTARLGPPEELGAYLVALSRLLTDRSLAVDVGTGDGALLEVLSPMFESVVALDRSEPQLALARERVARLGVENVRFVAGELEGPEIEHAVRSCCAERSARDATRSPSITPRRVPSPGRRWTLGGADAVFASRLLHHAPSPGRALRALARLARPGKADRPGGAVLVVDYESHGDESLRADHADFWLGFDPPELVALAEQSGLCQIERVPVPAPWCGAGPDHHLKWQLLVGRRAAPSARARGELAAKAVSSPTSGRRREAAASRAGSPEEPSGDVASPAASPHRKKRRG